MSERDPRAQQAQILEELRDETDMLFDQERQPIDQQRSEALTEAIAALRAQSPVQETCVWTLDADPGGDTWDSACGGKWCFIEGDPAENKVRFCHGCGKPLSVPASQREDEQVRSDQSGVVIADPRGEEIAPIRQRVLDAGRDWATAASPDEAYLAAASEALHYVRHAINMGCGSMGQNPVLVVDGRIKELAPQRAGTVQELSRASVTPSASAAPSTAAAHGVGSLPPRTRSSR